VCRGTLNYAQLLLAADWMCSLLSCLVVFVFCPNFFSFVVKSEPIDLLNVAFEQQHNSNIRYIRLLF